MRIILGTITTIFVIVVVAVIAIPLLVSTNWIRDQVVAAVNEKTGRNLTIAGETSLSVFPDLALNVGHVSFSNPDGAAGSLIRMDELDVGLKLLPLLGGGVEIDRLILERPVFALEIDENGRANWHFNVPPAGDPSAAVGPASGAASSPRAGNPLAGIESVQLGDVRIVNGTVSYRDRRSGDLHEASEINAKLELPSLAEPLSLAGTAAWLGEIVTFSTVLTEPGAVTNGAPSDFSVEIETPQLKTALAGRLTVGDSFDFEGELDLSTPSVRGVGRWLGFAMPEVAGLGAFSAESGIKADDTGFALDNASLSLDEITAEGGVLVSLSGPVPLIRATLAASRIDLGDYLAADPAAGTATSGGAASPVAAAPNAGSAGSDWNDDPIDLSGLRSLDADIRVSAAGLTLGEIVIGQSALSVTLKDALLSLDLSELQLYEGRAAGKLTINAAGDTPAVAAAFNIDNVAARPLLEAATDIDWLEGRGRMTGSLASRGTTQRALISAVNGETAFSFTNGAIRGINVAQMVRNLQVGNITAWDDGESQKTDFSELSAHFTITRGIAQTNDLRMLGPLVRLTGTGIADLPNRTVDFRINPKIVASLEGQGGSDALAGVDIPILVRGPWDSPRISLDVEGALKDPASVIDAVGGVVKDLTGKDIGTSVQDAIRNPGGLLDRLTGGNRNGAPDPGPNGGQGGGQPAPIGEDVFKRLMGR